MGCSRDGYEVAWTLASFKLLPRRALKPPRHWTETYSSASTPPTLSTLPISPHSPLRLPRSSSPSAIAPDASTKQNVHSCDQRAAPVPTADKLWGEHALSVMPRSKTDRSSDNCQFPRPKRRVAIKISTFSWRVLTTLSHSAWSAWVSGPGWRKVRALAWTFRATLRASLYQVRV